MGSHRAAGELMKKIEDAPFLKMILLKLNDGRVVPGYKAWADMRTMQTWCKFWTIGIHNMHEELNINSDFVEGWQELPQEL